MHGIGVEEISSHMGHTERPRPLVPEPNRIIYPADHSSSQRVVQSEFQDETRFVVVLSPSLADSSEARNQRSVNDNLVKGGMADLRQAVHTLLLEAGVHIAWMWLAPTGSILISLIIVLVALSVVLSWPRLK